MTNASPNTNNRLYGTEITYTCSAGHYYYPVGQTPVDRPKPNQTEDSITCEKDEKWTTLSSNVQACWRECFRGLAIITRLSKTSQLTCRRFLTSFIRLKVMYMLLLLTFFSDHVWSAALYQQWNQGCDYSVEQSIASQLDRIWLQFFRVLLLDTTELFMPAWTWRGQ